MAALLPTPQPEAEDGVRASAARARRVRSAGCGGQLRLEAPDPGIGLLRLGCQRLGISPGAAVSRRFAVVRRLDRCRAAAQRGRRRKVESVGDDRVGGAQHRGEQRRQVEVSLACGAYDAGEDLLGVGALAGAVAAAHLADDDGGPDGLFGAPVGGVDRRVPQEREDGAEFASPLALPCTHIIRSGQLQHAPAVQCGSRWLRWTFVRNRAT